MPESKCQVPIAKPFLGEEEAAAARRVILSGWVTQGPEVAAFERDFAESVGAPHACAVANCTAALHLALLAVGVQPGDEVITVSHSFIATANSIHYCGARPVFVDIDPATFNMNPELIETAISHRSRAILCVHQMGMPCDMKPILDVARRHGLPVVEDAACAIGSDLLWNGTWDRIGKPHGDIACFSFHPRKLITTGDGGMLTTANADVDKQLRLFRQHGMSVPDTVRHASDQVIFESYSVLGFNYRMTDIQAAVGRVQLKRLSGILKRRKYLADRYATLLADIPDVILPVEGAGVRTNWQSYCVRLPHRTDLKQVMQSMMNDGISTRRGIMCAHLEDAYAPLESWTCGQINCDRKRSRCGHLRHSEEAQQRSIILPLFERITEQEQYRAVTSLRNALRYASDFHRPVGHLTEALKP